VPIVSVVIPVFNGETTILETVRSALRQTFVDIEVIVINDGSSDNTLGVLDSVRDPRLKVYNFPNSGGSTARNRGIYKSTGEFIAFLDADDFWLENKIELQIEALQSYSLASSVYCWVDTIDLTGKIRPASRATFNGNIYIELLKNCFIVSGSNILVRRDALESINYWDETLTASQDYDLYLRLAEKYEFAHLPQVLVLYRISEQSMSTNFKRLERTSMYVRRRALKKLPAEKQVEVENSVIGGYYKSTIWRYLELPASTYKGFTAIKYLIKIIILDPFFIFKNKKLTIIIIIKAILFIFRIDYKKSIT